jgi:hypothetical protein
MDGEGPRERKADALFVMIGARGKRGWLPEELQRDAKSVFRGYKAFAPSVDLNKGEQPVKIEMEKEAKAKDKDQEPPACEPAECPPPFAADDKSLDESHTRNRAQVEMIFALLYGLGRGVGNRCRSC